MMYTINIPFQTSRVAAYRLCNYLSQCTSVTISFKVKFNIFISLQMPDLTIERLHYFSMSLAFEIFVINETFHPKI